MRRKMAKKIKTRLQPSTIHGQGLFADQKIPAETWIIQYTGQKVDLKEGRRRDRFYNSIGYTLLFKLHSHYVDGLIGGNESIYINHSLTPNAEAFMHRGGVWIQALRDIAEGEEITYDYGFDPANPAGNKNGKHKR